MLNKKSLDSVAKSHFGKGFCKPLYPSYCFSRIPQTIFHLLTGKGKKILPKDTFKEGLYDNVVLFLIDGFGWRFFEKYAADFPFLQRFINEGIASKITSEFPSTTAAHITSINTGLSVGESGVYEWFYFEPKLDQMIAPLLFSFAGDKEKETLKKTSILPSQIYPTKTFHQFLAREGIRSFAFQEKELAASTYSQTLFDGAHRIIYTSFSQALAELSKLLLQQKKGEKNYFYLYFPDVDAMAHRHGIDSPHVEHAVKRCFTALEELFWKQVDGKGKFACLVTADHGMCSIHPKTTLYLNEAYPQLIPYLKRNRAGDLLVPAGSCRDFFLHIEEKHLESAASMLQGALKGKAEVYLTEQLTKEGFFGEGPCSSEFLERVGNLVILPYTGESVWWHEEHRFEQHFYAAHGGLSCEEMESIFLFL